MTPADDEVSEADGLPEQMRVRREKLDRLRERGVDPYPVTVRRTSTLGELRARFPDLSPDATTGETVAVAGRIVLKRDSGKLCFATLRDGSGPAGSADLQVMLSLDKVGSESLESWKRDVDLGDHVSVEVRPSAALALN